VFLTLRIVLRYLSPSVTRFSPSLSEEGSDCGILLLIGGPPPVVECSSGLVCSRDTKTCVPEATDETEEAEE
jgi:hypothetical protein